MTSRATRTLFVTASGLLTTSALLYVALFGMLDVLRGFKVECPALTLLTLNVMHLADGLLWPCAVVAITILLCRRAAFSWYGALALCPLCDVMALGIVMPLISLSNSLGMGTHPTQLPMLTAIPLVALALNQIVLLLLFAKRREFFVR